MVQILMMRHHADVAGVATATGDEVVAVVERVARNVMTVSSDQTTANAAKIPSRLFVKRMKKRSSSFQS